MSERRNLVDELNRCMPAAAHAQLGTKFNELQAQHNDLVTKFNALLAKLDSDTVGGADYVDEITEASEVETLSDLSG